MPISARGHVERCSPASHLVLYEVDVRQACEALVDGFVKDRIHFFGPGSEVPEVSQLFGGVSHQYIWLHFLLTMGDTCLIKF